MRVLYERRDKPTNHGGVFGSWGRDIDRIWWMQVGEDLGQEVSLPHPFNMGEDGGYDAQCIIAFFLFLFQYVSDLQWTDPVLLLTTVWIQLWKLKSVKQ